MNGYVSLLAELPTWDTERYALEAYYEGDKLCFTRADFNKTDDLKDLTDGDIVDDGRIFDITGRELRTPEKGQLFITCDRRLHLTR